MANHANYRKYNDHSQNSSTYHKKDGTPVRAKLKREAETEIKEEQIWSGQAFFTYEATGERVFVGSYDVLACSDDDAANEIIKAARADKPEYDDARCHGVMGVELD